MNNKICPAFPASGKYLNASEIGLTKREWYAGMALQGMLAKGPEYDDNALMCYAYDSVRIADMILAELAK